MNERETNMGLDEAKLLADQVSNDLMRSRLLGTTPPTDEEIHEMASAVMDSGCDECEANESQLDALDACEPEDTTKRLADLFQGLSRVSRSRAESMVLQVVKALQAKK